MSFLLDIVKKRLAFLKSKYPNIHLEDVVQNPHLTLQMILDLVVHETNTINPSQCFWISRHPEVTMDFVLKHPEFPWIWTMLASHKNITMDDISRHPEIPWEYPYVSCNPNLTLDYVTENSDHNWDWRWISSNKAITFEMIESNPNLPWQWSQVSINPNVKLEHVLKHIEKPWCWYSLTVHPNITLDMIKSHPNLPWQKASLTYNPSFTPAHIEDPFIWREHNLFVWGQSKSYVQAALCRNDIICLDYVLSLSLGSDDATKWRFFSKNKNMTWDIALKYKNEPGLDWKEICKNVPLRCQDIIDHPEIPWQWHSLLLNPHLMKPTLEEIRELFCSKIICKWVFHCFTNPNFLMCRRRLEREYNSFVGSLRFAGRAPRKPAEQ